MQGHVPVPRDLGLQRNSSRGGNEGALQISDFGDGVATGDDLADRGPFFTVIAFGDNY